ncbi:MAG: SusC/RagA family TonB-linked outer membrane protein [Sphingobacterium sp.]|jgi:TonB-linked SusC/RagA family outer membrane protein|nr:SusC/RagA family TonB-linked outer membrane protein [Sphingobacterium sp.]
MKTAITAMICSLFLVHISAKTVAQMVTLRQTKITLKDAFKEINKQTGYHYIWSAQQVESNRSITVNIKNQPLREAIQSIIQGLPLTYELDGKLIIIKEQPVAAERKRQLAQEGMTVRGRVTDSLNNGLLGVTVKVLSADLKILKYASSNGNGDIYIEHVPEQSYLEFSLLGYLPQRIKAAENIGTLRLRQQSQYLDELVVVGYLNKKASEVTGAVQQVSGDVLRSSVTSSNVLSMLKGKTAGLYITETSGESGAKGQVVERGQSSMTTPTNNYLGPLIVVDGVITNYQAVQDAVNPADVENISILKDASSTAIYGSRAAQGVIVVTTKRGQSGRSIVDAHIQYGTIQPKRDLRFMNTTELIGFMDQQMRRYWEQTESIRKTFPDVNDFIRERRVYTDADRSRNFNWEDAIYSKGNLRNTEVSVRNGNDKTKFYAGIGWFKENGALYDNSFDRKSLRVNIDHAVSRKFHTSLNLSTIVDRTSKRNGIPELYMIQPFMSPYDEQGNLLDSLPVRQSNNYGPATTSWTQNFLAEKDYDNTRLTNVQNHLGSLRLRYDILPELSIQSTNSINYMGTNINSYYDPRSFSGRYGGFPYLFRPGMAVPNGTLDLDDTKMVDYLTSNTLNYRKNLGPHNLSVLVGQEWGKRTTEISSISLNDMLAGERNMGAAKRFGTAINLAYSLPYSPTGAYRERATFSVFGQADYAYRQKYLASASVRTDATTNFGRDKRYGTFYSLSGGWMLSAEDFLKDVKAINSLKLRASYGTSGRDLGDGYLNTTFYATGTPGGLYRYEQEGNTGVRISQLANPLISWETLYNTNIGVDALLFSRLGITFDIYHKRSDGLLQNVLLPSAQGSLAQYQNVGQIVNKGLELILNAHIIKSKDFNWHSSLNFSFNKNKLTKLYQDSLLDSYSGAYYRKIGEDINVIKAVEYAGINPDNGNMQHYNFVNGEKTIVQGLGTTSDLRNWQTVGSATPKFFGGFTNTFQYKAFTLSAEWWFQYGNYLMMSIVNNFQSPTSPRLGRNNIVFGDNQQVWKGPGDTEANYPDVFSTDPNAWSALSYRSSRLWGNGSHARLRNVRLAYKLPGHMLKTVKLANATVYISGDNLLLIKDKDFVGADPEGAVLGATAYGGVGTGFANPRRFLVGVQVTF